MLFCELLQNENVAWADGGALTPVNGLSLDSRVCSSGTLFFCIPGARYDGHDFAKDAYARGCRHFVAEHILDLPPDASVLICRSVREKMAFLSARYYRDPAKGMRLIGITGTKGKTTTALMLRELLGAIGVEAAYIGSSGVIVDDLHINTENTTPPSLEIYRYLRMIADRGIKVVIMEVSSQALAFDRVAGLSFSLGVFTNLSRDHIGAGEHADMSEYRRAKMRLFTEYRPPLAVLNAEDELSFDIIKTQRGRVVLYGNGEGTSLSYRGVRMHRDGDRLCTSFRLRAGHTEHEVTLGMAGEHYILDFLAALSSAALIGDVSYETLLCRLPPFRVAGRCEVYAAPNGALFVIDYAHNGASLGAALRGLRPFTEGRLLCLFGAVGERTGCRRVDMAKAAEIFADFSVVTSDNPGGEDAGAIADEIVSSFCDRTRCSVILDREEAIRYLFSVAGAGDVVLLAGKGNEKYQLSAEGKHPFCERKILEKLGFLPKK